jgi:large subunit ribosomal protein L31
MAGSGSRSQDDPATDTLERKTMKKNVHPDYTETQVTCTCGNSFTTRSTVASGSIRSDVCSQCHPFYTGKQKILDTGGRVARFEKRYAQKTAEKSAEKSADANK